LLLLHPTAAAAAAGAGGADAVVIDDAGEAEITQLEGAVLVKENVGGF